MNFFLLFTSITTAIAHVLSGPDHLSAVTPMMIESPKKAYLIGSAWALGHSLGILLIGLLYLIFKESIPFESISQYSEQIVGVVLITIGLRVFYKLYREPGTSQHSSEATNSVLPETKVTQSPKLNKDIFPAIGIGFIHGLAGVSHFFLFLPVLSLKSHFESIQYIFGFALGSLIAMVAYSLLISRTMQYTKKANSPLLVQAVRVTGGLFSMIIGIYWLMQNFY